MIDTDKYENHDMIRVAKALLIEDAPLILADYKRLRELLDDYRRFHTWVSEKHYEVIEEWDYMEGVKEEEE